MHSRLAVLVAVASAAFSLPAQNANSPSDPGASVGRQLPALAETYKNLHRNPELSHHEEKTSAYLAGELRKLGYKVTEHVVSIPMDRRPSALSASLRTVRGRA